MPTLHLYVIRRVGKCERNASLKWKQIKTQQQVLVLDRCCRRSLVPGCSSHTLTGAARMKRIGFYVNCLSAEMHTDPFFHRAGGVWELLRYGVCSVCMLCLHANVCLCALLCQTLEKPAISTYLYTCLLLGHSDALEYDVEALVMDGSASWKGGQALIYSLVFPRIFIGFAKCHYTAGGEVMNCNKL